MSTNTIRRPGFITFLAVLHFIGAAVWVAGLAFCLFGAASANADTRYGLNIVAMICAVLAGLQLACGLGLLSLRPFGRILQIVLAIPFLLSIPFGTAISILLIVYLNKPGIRLMFSDRPSTSLSPAEHGAVHADSGVPGVAVALIVLIAIGPVFALPITAAIAIPALLRARMTANEAAATAALDVTTVAQVAYMQSCGNGGYASSYAVLGTAAPGKEPFIAADLGGSATPQKSGYSFSLQAGAESQPGPADCMGRPTVTSWYATARPQSFGATGSRSFAANEIDGVWENRDRVPPAEPFRRPSTRVR
jgi:hypothetical protein